jgi:hypothetical protein
MRIRKALGASAYGLSEIRGGDLAGALSTILALVWRQRLGPKARAFLLTTACQAVGADDLEEMRLALEGVRSRPLQKAACEPPQCRRLGSMLSSKCGCVEQLIGPANRDLSHPICRKRADSQQRSLGQ